MKKNLRKIRESKRSRFIKILNDEFEMRLHRNPKYSLRAFANALGLSHTTLSLAFSGKRNLSKRSAMKAIEVLGLDPCVLNDDSNMSIDAHFDYISLQDFSKISNWVYYAILSILDCEEYQDLDIHKKIASRLGIDEMQAYLSFRRLAEMGLISKDDNGCWKQSGKYIKIENDDTTEVTRKFHHGLLVKALESLDTDPVSVRDFSSITMAMNPGDIPWARKKIQEFRRHLSQELENKNQPTEVYNLTVQIYPVSKIKFLKEK